MKKQHYSEVQGTDAAPGVVMRVLAGEKEGAPTFAMRLFEIQPGCGTPHHTHPWEHEMFIVSGEGTLVSGEKRIPLKEGDAVMVPPDEQHGLLNTGTDLFRLICLVPLIDGVMPSTLKPA